MLATGVGAPVSVGAGVAGSSFTPEILLAPPSDDVTVVELTCLLPEDLRPLEEPDEFGECCDPREADRGAFAPGGLPPVLLGEPGGILSATDIRAAIGD